MALQVRKVKGTPAKYASRKGRPRNPEWERIAKAIADGETHSITGIGPKGEVFRVQNYVRSVANHNGRRVDIKTDYNTRIVYFQGLGRKTDLV